MHPVQAAPRQRISILSRSTRPTDAPRAGSAEAKLCIQVFLHPFRRCTPCRQRRGKAAEDVMNAVAIGMHPVQAAPRQSGRYRSARRFSWMHPVQAAPRQSFQPNTRGALHDDAPRAGSAEAKLGRLDQRGQGGRMHPVQAAPRQRPAHAGQHEEPNDAPRAGSAEAKPEPSTYSGNTARCTPCRQRRGKDAALERNGRQRRCTPCRQRRGKGAINCGIYAIQRCTPCRQRRGKVCDYLDKKGRDEMHPVQAAHSEITTCRPMVL